MTANVQNQDQPQEVVKSNEKELNFRKQEEMFKRQIDQERLARQQAEEKLAQAEKAMQAKQPNDDIENDDEPYVDKRKLQKVITKTREDSKEEAKQIAQTAVREALAEERRNQYLKSNNDFNEIMSQENLEKFMNKHPDLAEHILNMPDTFERQKLVYTNIKTLGIHKKEEDKPSIQQKIDANRRSPFYQPSGTGSPPYASAGDFSPSGKKNAYDQMQALKQRLRLG